MISQDFNSFTYFQKDSVNLSTFQFAPCWCSFFRPYRMSAEIAHPTSISLIRGGEIIARHWAVRSGCRAASKSFHFFVSKLLGIYEYPKNFKKLSGFVSIRNVMKNISVSILSFHKLKLKPPAPNKAPNKSCFCKIPTRYVRASSWGFHNFQRWKTWLQKSLQGAIFWCLVFLLPLSTQKLSLGSNF